ncbi:protein ndvB [Rhizobium sp. B230/85]|uniref:GH36-type glycosyl hydrolase domain-containing protein n=1 Tax=unclassified Rhizobium TaxID=2613769 RepID=UPI001ADB66A0|nr:MULTISPECIES: glucoamylase family protein [unclassified Rhizobium]MBO9135556.1 protein ndvB [Rhizobium sp. B209b/85]QXZ96286.1 protein ndvB [Rhizobium sp. B230/85]
MSAEISPTPSPRAPEAKLVDLNDSIRASFLSNDQLRECGEAFARDGADTLPNFKPFEFFARHRENETEILRVYRAAAADVEAGQSITPAAEWLLDNHYIVEEAIQEVRRDFPKKFYRQLPTMTIQGMVMPRALAVAWLYVAHTHSQISYKGLMAIVDGFQEHEIFKIGELWALPSLVRYALVDNLRRISIRVEHSRRMRGKANEAADELIRLAEPAKCAEYLKSLEPLTKDNTFATQFLYRLRDGSQTSSLAIDWLEQRMAAAGTDSEEVMMAEHTRLAAGNATMGHIIRSLREIDDTEWSVWVEEVSQVDKLLWTETDYGALDAGSRNKYRKQIEKLARRSDKTEIEIAQIAIDMTAAAKASAEPQSHEPNVGGFLVGTQRMKLEEAIHYKPLPVQHFVRQVRRLRWFAIAGPVVLLTILAMAIVGTFMVRAGMGAAETIVLLLMFSLPASEGATGLFNTLITLFVTPVRLVGYEFKEGIPEDARTLVVVPTLISNRDSVDELVRNLEVHYLANPRGEIYFALLSDWPDSKVEETPADLEVLDYARREIGNLSQRYNFDGKTRFYLLHRRRLYNPAEDVWMGWERKRGKLHELNLLLRGDRDTTFLPGANVIPKDIQYVMTLDSDTRLMRDTVTKLVGKLYHPINRPVVDPETKRVISGYGVLQPRVTPSLTTGKDASVFQRVFSINRGLDPYVFTVSDVYQDLAGEGTFTGKGLYHVDAFENALRGKIDENSVLSHDLLEGSMARCALVTDCELVEDYPIRYEVEVSRQHRWARGDWQLLPYIFNPSRGITGLGRWKMFDNLRRSLTPIAWFFASVLGWYLMAPFSALIWQIVLIFCLFVAPTLGLINGIIPRTSDIVARAHLYTVWTDIRDANAQVALRIVFLADSACGMADAIGRSIYRTFVSRKLMLQWRTAASAQAAAQTTILGHYKVMWQAPVLAVLALGLAALSGSNAYLVGIPFVVLWVLSPAVAYYVSQSAETEDQLHVSEHVSTELRKIARRTWRYFEAFVVEQQNFLPPDNVQQTPHAVVAPRTSPTNIGVYLLSVVSARHFGWLSFEETITRLEQTIATVDRMEKYRGHLLNWYHTDTLKTLGPRYVSAVDSGNLAGHLIAVSSACRIWAEAPSAHMQGNLDGVGDVSGVLQEILADLPDDRKTVRPLRRRLEERIIGFQNALAAVKREHEFASIRVINLAVLARDIKKLAANLDHEVKSPQSAEVIRWSESLIQVCEAHIADSVFDLSNVEALRQRLINLRDRTRDIAFSMDFAFLFRPERRLLSIGYRVESGELDAACYDLLASEARLTSLFAIAKGDLPTEHWYRLGRQVVPVGSRGALVSWSGSMFEYLMPPLVMQERQGGILNQTNNLIVIEQMNYGRRLGVPWGISEAAFNARDHQMNYQYTNFGVPSLGLKRGLGQNAVIAPYASLLAAMYDPEAALENLNRLRKVGALGMYGFHDAVDFTPTRVPDGKKFAIVYNYYAHHHGMSIAAVANVAFNGRLRELFHADPVIEAAELLLQEKAPRDIPVMAAKHETDAPANIQEDLLKAEVRKISNPARQDREIALLSNGHYSVMLTATGSGYSRWNGLAVSRWKPDPTEDRWGTFIFLRDTVSHQWWSATSEPRSIEGEKASVIFSDDKAEYSKTVGELTSDVECIIATDHDAEGRRVTLHNAGSEDRFIEVTSYLEPVIANEDVDAAHPVFARMFVKTEIGELGDVIRVERNKRDPNEPDMTMAHMVVDNAGSERPTEFETDRRRFIGRGRSLGEAAAFDPGTSLSGTDGFTLDACLSLRRVIRVPAGKKVSVIFWTIAAPNREDIDRAVERFRNPDAFGQEMVHAWTRTQVQMRQIGVTSQHAKIFQHLARYLVYPDMHLRAEAAVVHAGLQPQSALWPLAISGDHPIFTLRINDDIDLEIAKEALSAQEYLRSRGIIADLVIMNERAASYAQDMQHDLDALCESVRHSSQGEGLRPHIFAARKDLMEPETYQAVLAASRVVFHARNGTIVDQITRAPSLATSTHTSEPEMRRTTVVATTTQPVSAPASMVDKGDLDFWNGYGGFSSDGREYVVRLFGGQSTPQPWINVISNENFGFHVAAEGAAFTWSANSRDYQLTSWSNDMVINRPGEALYVADLVSGAVMTPYAALSRRPSAAFEARHGLGYSVFTSVQDEISLEVTQTVDRTRPVKMTRLRLRNEGTTVRRLRLYNYAEWVLGNNPRKTGPFILSSQDAETGALFASNPYSIDYSRHVAFMASSETAGSISSSRREFIGRAGSIQLPQAVVSGAVLSGSLDLEGDPCAAMAIDVTLEAGEQRDICFYMGDTASTEEARALVAAIRSESFDDLLEASKTFWNGFTGRLQISTPDKAMNNMVNAWLPYQSLGCRIMARTAFYQASGAFGFRDQLQDTLAFLTHSPELARKQILNAASRQFHEGDVQHWWLPGTGAGVRTHISDDVVWLAYAINQYCTVTGDRALLDEELAFVEGASLTSGMHDAFYKPEVSSDKVSLYEHAALALDLAIRRKGGNGLPLILGGDWNDGMNRVGMLGRGESTWLGWFLAGTLTSFIPYAEARGDSERVARWSAHLPELKKALETAGWDGGYYRRGYFDDGTPLGSNENFECQIDSIAQSWNILSGEGDRARGEKAMDAVLERLVDDDKGIIRLFTPAFAKSPRDPGYIRSYPPGVRENGGQYTHAATWVVLALAEMGRGDDAWRCFNLLNPVNHALDKAASDQYRVEPYVVAADIYGEGQLAGRGGWSWYTGSAGWMYRVAIEGLLGIRVANGHLHVKPALPSAWDGFTAELDLSDTKYRISVSKPSNAEGYLVTINGTEIANPDAGFAIGQ